MKRPFLYLILAIFAVSSSSILVRLCISFPLIIALYRQTFSAIILVPFLMRQDLTPLAWRSRLQLILSGFFLALHFATWITGLGYTTVARATLFVDLQPIWGAILGALILKERLTMLEAAAILLVTAGGGLTVASHWNAAGTSIRGDVLALIGGIAGACYFLIGRRMRTEISWLRYMFSVYFYSAAWLLLFSFLLFRSIPLPADQDLAWIALMALLPSLAGHGLFNLALRKLKAYVVNASFLGEPILATMLAYLLFGEQPDRAFYIGAVFVFSGLLLLFSKQRRATAG